MIRHQQSDAEFHIAQMLLSEGHRVIPPQINPDGTWNYTAAKIHAWCAEEMGHHYLTEPNPAIKTPSDQNATQDTGGSLIVRVGRILTRVVYGLF